MAGNAETVARCAKKGYLMGQVKGKRWPETRCQVAAEAILPCRPARRPHTSTDWTGRGLGVD